MTEYKPLTAEELTSIRAREEQATPGDWTIYERKVEDGFVERGIGTSWENPNQEWTTPVVSTFQTGRSSGTWIERADAEFIAESRTDVPRLLDMLALFGEEIIYAALSHYYRRGLFNAQEGRALQEAMKTCLQIAASQGKQLEGRDRR